MLCTRFKVVVHAAEVCIYNMSVRSYICTRVHIQVYHFSSLEKSFYSRLHFSFFWFIFTFLFFPLPVEIEGLRPMIDPLTWYYRGQFICSPSALPLVSCSFQSRALFFHVAKRGERIPRALRTKRPEIGQRLVFLGPPQMALDPSRWIKKRDPSVNSPD